MSLFNQWQALCEELKLEDPSNVKIKEDLERIVFQSDRYIYEYTITVGGMGEIQSVFDNKLMRRVARKVLNIGLAEGAIIQDHIVNPAVEAEGSSRVTTASDVEILILMSKPVQ